MKALSILLLITVMSGCAVKAKSAIDKRSNMYPPNNGTICLLAGSPPADVRYEIIARVVATKRTYGSQDSLFEPMSREGRRIGADAIINLQASQKFKGPMPWRVAAPTGDGSAIKILPGSPRLDCEQVGGKSFGRPYSIKAITQEESSVDSAKPDDELYQRLLKLDDLRERGILTDDEFEAEKRKILEAN